MEEYRIDHYYAVEGGGYFEEGHIFCTPDEGEEIEETLRGLLPAGYSVTVEPGGEYDYTTELGTAHEIALDIFQQSFDDDEETD